MLQIEETKKTTTITNKNMRKIRERKWNEMHLLVMLFGADKKKQQQQQQQKQQQ